jgi:hypothetical protein
VKQVLTKTFSMPERTLTSAGISDYIHKKEGHSLQAFSYRNNQPIFKIQLKKNQKGH